MDRLASLQSYAVCYVGTMQTLGCVKPDLFRKYQPSNSRLASSQHGTAFTPPGAYTCTASRRHPLRVRVASFLYNVCVCSVLRLPQETRGRRKEVLRKLEALNVNPGPMEVHANSNCRRCRAAWSRTGPICGWVKMCRRAFCPLPWRLFALHTWPPSASTCVTLCMSPGIAR